MPKKFFTHEPIGWKNTYLFTTIFYFLAGIWFALAPILIETKEGSLLVTIGISVLCIFVASVEYRTLKRIVGYEKLAKGKRVILDTNARHIRVEHREHSIEFYNSDIHAVRIYEAPSGHRPSSYFGYILVELKEGRKVIIPKSIASVDQLRAGLYKTSRESNRKHGHPVPEDIEF